MTTALKQVKRPAYAIRKQAKKLKIKITVKRGGKRLYKKESLLKRQIKRKMKVMKVMKSKMVKRKTVKRKVVKRKIVKRRAAFGVGGSYMPLASMMSPYPRSVDASPPWI
jgi:hypothetical protein